MNARPRKPAAFSLPAEVTPPAGRARSRTPAAFDDAVTLTPDVEDPFIATTADLPDLTPPVAIPRKRRITLGRIALGARRLQVAHVARVQQIEHAVGEDHASSLGAQARGHGGARRDRERLERRRGLAGHGLIRKRTEGGNVQWCFGL